VSQFEFPQRVDGGTRGSGGATMLEPMSNVFGTKRVRARLNCKQCERFCLWL
jgi:hypothetical protein